MKVYYKIMDGIEVLPNGFTHGKWYEIIEEYISVDKTHSFYSIDNNRGYQYTFNDFANDVYYIWRYFYTVKDIRRLKLEVICST